MTTATTEADPTTGTNDNGSDNGGGTVQRVKESATHAYDSARESAREASQKAGEQLETNPLAILVGGIAVGLLAGLAIPRHEKERDALASLGQRLAEGATAALVAARETGREELEGLLPDKSAAKEQASTVFSRVLNAAVEAAKTK